MQPLLRDTKVEVWPTTEDTDKSTTRLEFAMVLVICVIAWILSHRYQGIFHDARLYTLEALAHLDTSLAKDVFLRFGSQDRFTIFGPIYAAVIQLLGTEVAAATLTFAFQIVLFTCAWLLARTVMPSRLALYGVAVLVAIPGEYGAERIFTCVEAYVTPRMAAEALTLAGLATALRARPPYVAGGLILAAAMIHPLMACAGLVALLFIYVALPYPRLGFALAAAAGAALLLGAFTLPTGIWGRFDARWLRLVMDRSPWLFVSNWLADDWARAAVTVATLIVGSCTAIGAQARILCQACLLTTVAGLLLTFIACDELHLVLVTQLQPWRWEWLGIVTAALLLPLVVHTRWQTDLIGRTTAVFLTAAWIFAANEFAVVAALASVASVALTRRLTSREARLVFGAACGLLAIAIVWRIASNLEFTDSHYTDFGVPLWLRRAVSFAHDGSAPLAALLLAWWLAHVNRGGMALALLTICAAAACAALLPETWIQWTVREYPQGRVAQFTPWRERIPPGSDVFWPELPMAAWMLLDRPSYLSVIQSAGIVFSRETAFELERRAIAIATIVPPNSFLGWNGPAAGLNLSVPQLQNLCGLAAFEFLVTNADLGVAPAGFIPNNPSGSTGLRLYHCPIHN